MSDQSPGDCMMLCDLDGFLTGIAIGPDLIMPSEWLPVIWGGDVIAADWAEGFMHAVTLRPAAWKRLLTSEKNVELMLPILALCCDDDGEPLLDLPQDVEDRLFAEAGDLIPECVLAIADYWRTAPMCQTAGPKTGRNDPCPCGSGKKFKKCCGTN